MLFESKADGSLAERVNEFAHIPAQRLAGYCYMADDSLCCLVGRSRLWYCYVCGRLYV